MAARTARLDSSAKEVAGRVIRLASLFQQANREVLEPLGRALLVSVDHPDDA